jgi:hypothetical protein
MVAFDPGRQVGLAAVGRDLGGDPAIDLFIPASGNGLLHTWSGPSGWHQGPSGEIQLHQVSAPGDDQVFSQQPSAVSWAPDRLDVFAVNEHGDLWHFWAVGTEQPPSSWSGESLGRPATGGLVSGPGAVTHGHDKIMVFARSGRDGTLMACVWDPAAGERWRWHHPVDELGWAEQPREFVFSPVGCSWAPSRIDLFCVSGTTRAGTLEHTWQQDFPDNPAWHPDYWEQPKAFILTSTPAAVSWSDPGQIFVIYRNVAGIDGSSVGMSHWTGRSPAEALSRTAGHFYLDWENDIIYQQVSSDDTVMSFPTLASWQKNRLDAFWIRSDLQLQRGWVDTVADVKDWNWENLPVAWPSS